ncbi:MAG: hypothetical protein J7L12_01105 [Desulfurococcales archaeon]|nr:hypothetical protein [Desulfurococcales archaeon]
MREINVAKKLGVSRQAISKSIKDGVGRLSQIFLEVAEVLNADIIRVNLCKGYAVLKSRQLNVKVYVFYIPEKGIRVLFGSNIDCRNEELRSLCADIVDAAKKWGIIKENEEKQNINELIQGVTSIVEA